MHEWTGAKGHLRGIGIGQFATSLPGSFCRNASSAEASRTALLTLSPGAPVLDQLIREGNICRDMRTNDLLGALDGVLECIKTDLAIFELHDDFVAGAQP